MKRNSVSLPSLFPKKDSKLFDKTQLKLATINLKKRFENQALNNNQNTEGSSGTRAFIQFPKDLFQNNTTKVSEQKKENEKKGFFPFRQINKEHTDQIISIIGRMRTRSTLLNKQIKAQVLFNKKSYNQMNNYCDKKGQFQKHLILQKLKGMQPIDMKKPIKTISKTKKQTQKQICINLSINYHIYESNLTKYKPYIDYDASIIAFKDKGYCVSGRRECPAVVFNRSENTWEQIQFKALKPFGESNPTVLNENQIIFFGGIRFYQPGLSLVINYIQILNLKNKMNNVIKFDQSDVPPRAFHAQCLYGQFLIISGGVDKSYHTKNDFVVYNYQKNYWNNLQIAKKPQMLKKGLAKHKILPIFHKRAKYLIYQQTKVIEIDECIKQQGVYIFGGEDGDLQLSNKLYILSLGKTQLQIKQMKTKGKSPMPRKSFSMIRFKQYMVVHGGRNDECSPFTLNSIHFLNLKTFQWMKTSGDIDIYRYAHSLINFKDTQIVIFGGKNDEGLSKEVYSLTVQQQTI